MFRRPCSSHAAKLAASLVAVASVAGMLGVQPASAGHVLDNNRGVAGELLPNVAGNQSTPVVVTAAGRLSNHQGHGFSLPNGCE